MQANIGSGLKIASRRAVNQKVSKKYPHECSEQVCDNILDFIIYPVRVVVAASSETVLTGIRL